MQDQGPILISDDEEMITNTWPALHSSAATGESQPFVESTDMLPCQMQAVHILYQLSQAFAFEM